MIVVCWLYHIHKKDKVDLMGILFQLSAFTNQYMTSSALYKWQILEKVKTRYDLPVVTDVHEPYQVKPSFLVCWDADNKVADHILL